MKLKSIFIFCLVFLVCHFKSHSQNYETIWEDEFQDNSNDWWLVSTEFFRSDIVGGKLISHFMEKDRFQVSKNSIEFDKNNNYELEFSIANLHNKKGSKYRIREQKDNGKIKEKWRSSPMWGFTWGFKDYDNYNGIIFYTDNDSYSSKTKYRVFSEIGGNTVVHNDWESDYSLEAGTSFNRIILKKTESGISIYTNNGYEKFLCLMPENEWFGPYFGSLIFEGAKTALDYIKISQLSEDKNDSDAQAGKVYTSRSYMPVDQDDPDGIVKSYDTQTYFSFTESGMVLKDMKNEVSSKFTIVEMINDNKYVLKSESGTKYEMTIAYIGDMFTFGLRKFYNSTELIYVIDE